ncbi:hypothetical protein NBRC116599_36270 [Aquicoccus sp. SU-CL01552]
MHQITARSSGSRRNRSRQISGHVSSVSEAKALDMIGSARSFLLGRGASAASLASHDGLVAPAARSILHAQRVPIQRAGGIFPGHLAPGPHPAYAGETEGAGAIQLL